MSERSEAEGKGVSIQRRGVEGRWRRLRRLAVLAVAGCALALSSCSKDDVIDARKAAAAEAVASDELPVTRVALYQNGVGYFERRGKIDGDVITLRIRPDQINDILKSLTVIDLGEGRPVSISLPVDKQAVDALAQVPTQIRDDGGILSLLQAFRGARVELKTSSSSMVGRVVGLENLERVTDGGHVVPDWRVTLKQDDGTLRVVALDTITALHMEDRTLEVGLEKSLDVSLNEGSWKPIELNVRMNEVGGEREVLVSYIVSMPIWKPAYRLVLGEEEQGLFQGWAVVDNVSGSDWRDVGMSLVAGTPMSFIYDLYRPQFVSRPDLTPRGTRMALAPELIESAMADAREMALEEQRMQPPAPKSRPTATATAEVAPSGAYGLGLKGAGAGGGGYAPAGRAGFADQGVADMPAEAAPIALEDYEGNFETRSEGSQLSALFQYDIGAPVTVPDRSSALVNLVQSRGKAREIVLFQPQIYGAYTDLHPYRAVELHNESGFALEPGPITLFKQGTFIGEGFLQRTDKEEVAYITFALDPQVRLSTSQSDSEEAASITRIEGGTIYSEVKRVTTVKYELTNERDEPLNVVIRRPTRSGWKLEPQPEGTLDSGSAHYIPIELGAREKNKVVELREVTPVARSFNLDSGIALDLLELTVKNGQHAPELIAQLQDVIDRQKALGEVRGELARLRAEKQELEGEQWRIASSLSEIAEIKDGAAKKLRADLVERASKLEAEIARRSTRITELSLQETDQELTLRALFRSISLK